MQPRDYLQQVFSVVQWHSYDSTEHVHHTPEVIAELMDETTPACWYEISSITECKRRFYGIVRFSMRFQRDSIAFGRSSWIGKL